MWDLRKWEDPCTKNDSKESEIHCGFKGLCPLAGGGSFKYTMDYTQKNPRFQRIGD